MSSFHIGFDSQIFRRQKLGGISRYFHDLSYKLQCDGVRVSSSLSPVSRLLLRQSWRNIDIIHATFYGGSPYRLSSSQGLVSTLFDMTPERHPEHFFLSNFRSPHANKLAWLNSSDRVISISASAADDLSFFSPSLHTPIHVIHLSTSIQLISPLPVPFLKDRRFWIMVGKRGSYKNGITLLRALVLLKSRVSDLSALPCLVYVGGSPFTSDELRLINLNGLHENVVHLQANDRTLAWLYRHADALLVPSVAEGFSLPLIEALVCNTPVVASDLEVHREVASCFATFLPAQNSRIWSDWFYDHSVKRPKNPSEILTPCKYNELCSYYSHQRMVDQHLDFYRGIL